MPRSNGIFWSKTITCIYNDRKGEVKVLPSMLKIRFPRAPAIFESAASSDTLKKKFSTGELAIDLISAIKFFVSMLFLM